MLAIFVAGRSHQIHNTEHLFREHNALFYSSVKFHSEIAISLLWHRLMNM